MVGSAAVVSKGHCTSRISEGDSARSAGKRVAIDGGGRQILQQFEDRAAIPQIAAGDLAHYKRIIITADRSSGSTSPVLPRRR